MIPAELNIIQKELKETLRLLVALEQIAKHNAIFPGIPELTDVIKTRIGQTDSQLTALTDQIREGKE